MRMARRGFTLIELLIVVAIIAILAAIAVPNFLQAQTRSKVSRVRADMRSLATGLNAYFVDHNHFPPDVHGYQGGFGYISGDNIKRYLVHHGLQPLTTPIAYMTSVGFFDPFGQREDPNAPFLWEKSGYSFQYYESSNPVSWGRFVAQGGFDGGGTPFPAILDFSPFAILNSFGPDTHLSQGEWSFVPGAAPTNFEGGAFIYDPTNGTVSEGDIVRGTGGLDGVEGPNL